MNAVEIRVLVDKGGLLRVTVPSGAKDGALALASEIQTWIDEAGAINGDPEIQPFLPAVKFLREQLTERLETLTHMPAPED